MPRTVAQGPPGHQAIHEATGQGVTLTINDLSVVPSSTARVIIDPARPLVLRSRPPADDNRQQKTARIGANGLPGVARDAIKTYPLLLQGPSREALEELRTTLLYVFSDTSVLNPMRFYVPETDPLDELVWRYEWRAIGDGGLDVDERALVIDDLWDSETRYQWTATLSLWMPDPRFYVDDLITLGPFTNASSHDAANTGRAPTDPIITGTRNALSADITVENLDFDTGGGTHATLKFVGVPTTSGDVVIDFADRTATIDTGGGAQTIMSYFSSTLSNWWDQRKVGLLPLNANEIKVTGLTDWEIAYHEASY